MARSMISSAPSITIVMTATAPRDRRCLRKLMPSRAPPSIEFEHVLVIKLERRRLVLLVEEAIADHQHLDIAAHKAAEGILRCAHDRLASDVEAGVDQNRTSGRSLERAQQRMKSRIGAGVDGLDPRGIIDMGHGRDVGARK